MIQTATFDLENAIVTQATQQIGRRLNAVELSFILQGIIRNRAATGEVSRMLALLLRLAIKAQPYAANIEALIQMEKTMMRGVAMATMAPIMATVERCNALRLPVPVIMSCEKYMAKAVDAQRSLTAIYFGIEPIIVRGDPTTAEERCDGSILILPCHDSYEALPSKVFDAFTVLEALGAVHGVIKIDDDMLIQAAPRADAGRLADMFGAMDYAGQVLRHPEHDRTWHFGKCSTPVPAVYGKPFRNPWARGALYFVSGNALTLLSQHYLRFPGCLDGEFYEDKAVGDILFQLGIGATDRPLEPILGIGTDAPERSMIAAE